MAVYKKRQKNAGGLQQPRFFLSTKAKATTVLLYRQLQKEEAAVQLLFEPKFKGTVKGALASEAAAWDLGMRPRFFLAVLNGGRPPSRRLHKIMAGTPKRPPAAAAVSELDAVLKAKGEDPRNKVPRPNGRSYALHCAGKAEAAPQLLIRSLKP
jgi:hypothetical protein